MRSLKPETKVHKGVFNWTNIRWANNNTLAQAFVCMDLSLIAQGTTTYSRVGNRIYAKKLGLRMRWQHPDKYYDSLTRVVVFQLPKYDETFKTPEVMFESHSNQKEAVLSFYEDQYPGRYRILSDETYHLTQFDETDKLFRNLVVKYSLNINKDILFNGGGGGNMAENSIHCMIINAYNGPYLYADDNVSPIETHYRLTYTDL